ncbi:hypothetical protein [Fusobacterium sp.]|uniref:hypothetical protein n=1 Tax=Fusobacterium sp. TaxID=68766 RepID=UPI0029036077|nr:hypothetical protein [Fusobacterium sp.]MDU1909615.1 hypothetical protein [Fusobacterium sp.]
MKSKKKYLYLFIVWGIFISLEIIFIITFYLEIIMSPIEIVGVEEKQNVFYGILSISLIILAICLVWFFIWKIKCKNQDTYYSFLTEEEKKVFFPLLLHENILAINRGFSLEGINTNSILWIHTYIANTRYNKNSLIIYFYKTNGKNSKITLAPHKVKLFFNFLDRITLNNPKIKITNGFLSKEYKNQKKWYKDWFKSHFKFSKFFLF